MGMDDAISLEEKILNIYWFKKELEEFLPPIAAYATPEEITAITLSQLTMMEDLLIRVLYDLSQEKLPE